MPLQNKNLKNENKMKNKTEDILQFLLAFSSLISGYYLSILENEKKLGFFIVFSALVLMTILVSMLTRQINERIMKLEKESIAALYEFERKIEGLWIERYNPEKEKIAYGLIEINYDGESKTTHLKGSVYDSEGSLLANWTSKSVYTDRNKKSIIYIYDGESANSRLVGNGYGKIDFSSYKLEKLVSATGCFEDTTTHFKPVNFELDRIDNGLCNEIIGKKIPEFSYERKNLILGYHTHINKFRPT